MFDVYNIDTFTKKFKKQGNFFSRPYKKWHPKTFILQDEKDACQSPALPLNELSTTGSVIITILMPSGKI